jgi:hypothetical protein
MHIFAVFRVLGEAPILAAVASQQIASGMDQDVHLKLLPRFAHRYQGFRWISVGALGVLPCGSNPIRDGLPRVQFGVITFVFGSVHSVTRFLKRHGSPTCCPAV